MELVAKAFAAVELKMDIVSSAEEQLQKLKSDYDSLLSKLGIFDPNSIENEKRIDDVTKWPLITMGNIFAYILQRKELNIDYIGKYKDQKAFSYFDSGFVGPILLYEPTSKQQEKVVFLYCIVTASQAIHESKKLWLAVKRINEKGSEILSGCCSCMAGSYETCNHVIACLYKLEYANTKGLCNPGCTETSCQWNQGTRREVKPKRMSS